MFFQQVIQHTAATITERFDFIAASRINNILYEKYVDHLQTFLKTCVRFESLNNIMLQKLILYIKFW